MSEISISVNRILIALSADFKREDLARTLLYTMCQHLAYTALTNMYATKTHHIFIAGSFISHPLVQRIVAEEFESQKWWSTLSMEGSVSLVWDKMII